MVATSGFRITTLSAFQRLTAMVWFVAMMTVCAAPAAQTVFSGLTAERLWQLVRPGQPVVSPDGKWVAFTVSAFADGATLPSVDIWLTDSAGRDEPRQLTRNSGADFDPAWAPDSHSIVYAAVPEGKALSQIFLLNLRGGAPQPLTDLATSASKPRFSPDGKSVYFQAGTYPQVGADLGQLSMAVSQASKRLRYARASDTAVIGSANAPGEQVQHIFSLDLASGVVTDLMPGVGGTGDVVPFTWDLSPGGQWLAYTANTSPPPYSRRNSDVFLMSLETAEVTNVSADNPGEDSRPVFSRGGGELLYGRRERPDALDEFRALMVYSHRQGKKRSLTDPKQLSVEQWMTSSDGSQIYFLAQQRGRRAVFRVGASGGKARPLTDSGSYSALGIDNKDRLYARYETIITPPVLHRLDRDGRHSVALTRFNELEVQNTRQPRVGEWTYTAPDGQSVHALTVYPPGWQANAPGPVVVALHGGPHGAWLDEFNRRWNLALIASQGYLVVALNVRGSTGYGQAFASAVNGDPLTLPASDTLAAVQALLAEPYVDANAMTLVGGSFGGMLALWVLSQTNQFAAGVVHAPVVEQSLVYGSDHPWGRHITWGTPPWREGVAAAGQSPLRNLGKIQTPVLALHGEADTRVPSAHSRLLHNALADRGVPSRIVLFPDEGHVINRPPAAQIWWQELFSWLQKHGAK